MVNKAPQLDKAKHTEDSQLSPEGLSVDELSSVDFSYDKSALGIGQPVVQKKEESAEVEEEEPAQMKSEESAEIEEEEPVQMMSDESAELEEEEPAQMKSEESTEMEEEEAVQMKGGDKGISAKHSHEGVSNALPEEVRGKMESSFGADFSNVKIHSDSSKASNIGALAYTQGNEIHFAPGQYQPDNKKGQELLGHELTHVVQQRNGRVQQTTQAKGMPVNDDSGLEKEADLMGAKAARGEKNVSVEEKNTSVESNIVQGYFSIEKAGEPYRVADDLSTAVVEGYPNHVLYAKSGKAATSNTALAAAGSGIELMEQSQTKTFWKGNKSETLKRVVPKNKINKTQGGSMKLWADCGKSNSVVVGGSNRKAGYNMGGTTKWTNSTSPSAMKAEIMRDWLTKKHGDVNTAVAVKQKIKIVLDSAKLLEAAMNKLDSDYGKAKTDAERETIAKNYFAKMDEWAEKLWSYYYSLDAAAKTAIDKELGVNRYAKPKVGEGYTTSSGGAPVAGHRTWNFHWGGVVMESTDATDKVVLENYAVGDASVENTKWDFAMYGTVKNGQTFHEQHKATNQHGKSPTTMRIDNK